MVTSTHGTAINKNLLSLFLLFCSSAQHFNAHHGQEPRLWSQLPRKSSWKPSWKASNGPLNSHQRRTVCQDPPYLPCSDEVLKRLSLKDANGRPSDSLLYNGDGQGQDISM
ncbi:MAG: hypothetical protein J3Q66DRAFT_208852 [Benniella sp.]|nr:MAG: hypothetical protein J3Q66DRAFT_208852 [Benniella sp.]